MTREQFDEDVVSGKLDTQYWDFLMNEKDMYGKENIMLVIEQGDYDDEFYEWITK